MNLLFLLPAAAIGLMAVAAWHQGVTRSYGFMPAPRRA